MELSRKPEKSTAFPYRRSSPVVSDGEQEQSEDGISISASICSELNQRIVRLIDCNYKLYLIVSYNTL